MKYLQLALLLAIGCDKPKPVKTYDQTIRGQIAGQVFVVVKSGESVKLGGVEVFLVNSNRFITTVVGLASNQIESDKSRLDDVLRESAETGRKLRSSESALSAHKADADRAIKTLGAAQDNINSAWRRYTSAQKETAQQTLDRYRLNRDQAVTERDKIDSEVARLNANAKQLSEEASALRSRKYEDYISRWFTASLRPVLAETITDADGKFALTGELNSTLVVCFGERELFESTERYSWAVQPSLDGPTLLNNRNLANLQTLDIR